MKLRDEELAVIRHRAERGVEQGIPSAMDMIAILDTIDALKAEHAKSLDQCESCADWKANFMSCDRERKKVQGEHAASLAAFAQRAAEPARLPAAIANNSDATFIAGWTHGSEDQRTRIRSLLPTADLEYQLALTTAKIEEAKFWSDMDFNTHIATEHTNCSKCGRLLQLEAEATRIKAAIEANKCT